MKAQNYTHKFDQRTLSELVDKLRHWSLSLGFQAIGITGVDLTQAEQHFQQWIERQLHGTMEYMVRHGRKRTRPAELEPGTVSIISARMDYLPEPAQDAIDLLHQPDKAYISRYSLGRDYHKVMRKRLQKLAEMIEQEVGQYGYRVFTDSAPVLEKALAENAGLGWIGKHSNVLQAQTGSWFFLGEIYTDLPLPVDKPAVNHCGTCQRCIEVCPTRAIIEPYVVDARLCISYLTIESRQSIPLELRPLMGNRIYGCDDCQLFCPWNRFAQLSQESDYLAREHLSNPQLVELMGWSETDFLTHTEGSAIRRIGHEAWLRNVAVALGNALNSSTLKPAEQDAIVLALQQRQEHPSELVREHVQWALQQRPES
jgi:epoxyqueuosine reductase